MTRLTPIRVRGKRKPKPRQTPASSLPQGNDDTSEEDDTVPPPGKRAKHTVSAVLANRKMRRPRSLIESLPLEVLEAILLYCRTFALPRASHLIGAKLSGKATLFKLFFAAFHDTWDQGFGKPRNLPYLVDDPRCGDAMISQCRGDPEMQSELLALPWVTLDFLLDAQQVWADKYARDRPYEHWKDRESFTQDDTHHAKHGPLREAFDPSRDDIYNARRCFEADYRGAQRGMFEWGVMRPSRMQDVHPLTRMPLSLITGPWTIEDRRLVFWIMRAGSTGHTTAYNHAPWEARVDAIRNLTINASKPENFVETCLMGTEAVVDGDHDLWLYHGIPPDVIVKLTDEIYKRLDWGDDDEETRQILRRTKGYLQDSMVRSTWRLNNA